MFLFSVKMQKTKIMKKSKRIELTENTIKYLAKKAIDEGKLFGVDAVFDGTDLTGVKICIKLSKNANPEKVVKQLYKETSAGL